MPRRKIRAVIAGLDLSLTGAGVAIVDASTWGLDVRRVESWRFGEKLKGSNETADHEARVKRLRWIAGEVARVCAHGVTHVFVENYSFGMQHAAHQLGEIGGVVKATLHERLGLVAVPVSNSTARKLFVGRGAGAGIKDYVAAKLREIGWTASVDEGDAFVVMNYGLSELGFPALSVE